MIAYAAFRELCIPGQGNREAMAASRGHVGDDKVTSSPNPTDVIPGLALLARESMIREVAKAARLGCRLRGNDGASKQHRQTYLSFALIASSAFEPGQSSLTGMELSGRSSVANTSCRSCCC